MKKAVLLVISFLAYGMVNAAFSAVPIATDNRIKTFVFNENEVFPLSVHYGYQSNIEFAKGETIQTLSLGDPYAWKVDPVGRRLFIKSLEEQAHTNMTVITSERTYQFDLSSRKSEGELDDELVYVIRFYYPEEHIDERRYMPPRPMRNAAQSIPVGNPALLAKSQATAAIPPAPVDAAVQQSSMANSGQNFNYTLTGPDTFAPLKVFDNGSETYIQFPVGRMPSITMMGNDGQEYGVTVRQEGPYTVLRGVAPRIYLRRGNELVCVFNESYRGAVSY